jgi:cytoskeletal protein RodZ
MDSYSLGRYLRETRESLELTLDDAVSTLKIRRRILENFEQGDFSVEGASTVQIRGFIRNYARYLQLDEALIIQYYESASLNQRNAGRRRRRRKRDNSESLPAAPSKTDTDPTLPRVTLGEQREAGRQRITSLLSTFAALLVGVAALAVIFFVVLQLLDDSESFIPEESSDILQELPPTPTRTIAPTFTPVLQITDVPAIQQDYTGTGVAVTVDVRQRAWMRVMIDGAEQLAELVEPGELLEYTALETIMLESSNAEALNIIYNGEQQGTFGARGQAVMITFTVDDLDIQTGPGPGPTSAFTPTPSPTGADIAATVITGQTPTVTPAFSPTPSDTPPPTATPISTDPPAGAPSTGGDPSMNPTQPGSAGSAAQPAPVVDTETPVLDPTVAPLNPTPLPTNTAPATSTPSPPPTNTALPTTTPTETLLPTTTAILPPRMPNITPTATKEG